MFCRQLTDEVGTKRATSLLCLWMIIVSPAAALSKYNISAGKKVTIGSTNEVAGSLALDLDAAQPLGANRFTVNLASQRDTIVLFIDHVLL